MSVKTNKLSIYLIKEEYTDHKNILKDINSLMHIELASEDIFYYGKSFIYPPRWLKSFFNDHADLKEALKNSSSKGVLLTTIEKDNKKRIFAITFGYGRQLLDLGSYEERFGLKVVLNVADHNYLRKIDKKNMSVIPKDTSEQLTKASDIAGFGIDIEQDLVRSITAQSKDKAVFGKMITGKDALSVSVRRDISSIKEFLELCYESYLSDAYKKDFEWIDYLAEIKDPTRVDKLNEELVRYLCSNQTQKVWMAVPEIIEWERISGFKYSGRSAQTKDDISTEGFLDSLTDKEKEKLTPAFLKRNRIYCIDAENEQAKHSWKVYDCIYCEIDEGNQTALLSNGTWYQVKQDFAKNVNDYFTDLRDKGTDKPLPKYNHKNEGDYNAKTAEGDVNLYCMDKKMISHGGGRGKVEFCDLLAKDKKLIHVKHYGGSSVLSHLFMQGLVSGELFRRDKEFRDKVNNKIKDESFRFKNTEAFPKPSEYEIIFAIISKFQGALEIPFFSKVSLRNTVRQLKAFGYKTSLLKISAAN